MKSRIVVAAVLVCVGAGVGAQAAEYSLKGPPEPNTSYRGEIANSQLPLDKPWDQFSDADKARMREQYATLAANEEPPFPQDGLKPIIDRLRVVQKKNSIEGELFAVVQVDEKGNARGVSFPLTTGSGGEDAIGEVLTAAKYKPAKCGNEHCAMEFPLYLNFKLIHSLVF